ncbi:hypothetical protein ANTQUA_LOCUS9679 [Anthophora quadrimaculata]
MGPHNTVCLGSSWMASGDGMQQRSGFWAGGIIGPFFFENAADQAITVNGARYRDMIIQFFVPKLQDIDVNDMWFQQDDATCHTAQETIQLLHESFPSRGFLKSKVYAKKPTTTHALKEKIKRCINEIQPHLCKTVMENFDKRVYCMCQQNCGSHLPNMLFHT